MGENDDKAAKRKRRGDALQKLVAGLTDPGATGALERARSVAKQFEYDNVAELLETSNDLMGAVLVAIDRGGKRYTADEAAERAGISPELFRQVNLAAGFADPDPEARVFTEEDIETFRLFIATTPFFGDDLAMQNIRVMGAAMSRVADAFISAFAVAVGRQSQEMEFGDDEIAAANQQASSLLPSAVQAMGVLLRRQIEAKTRPDIAIGAEFEGVDALDRSVGFCDLVGFTALSQQISNNELATDLRDFEVFASELIIERGGQVVKLIGDEIMFVSPDIETAFDIALALCDRFSKGDVIAPVRVGVAAGRVISREGDYFGPVVNLAARIVKLAPPSGVLAPATLPSGERYRYEPAGTSSLKGFDEPVELVTVTRV